MDSRNQKYEAPYYYGADGEQVFLPTIKKVCPVCDGEGKHVNPNIDSNGLSAEMENDPDFMDDYRSGVYDTQCNYCKGLRVVDALNELACTKEQLKEYYDLRNEMIADETYARQERLMGA